MNNATCISLPLTLRCSPLSTNQTIGLTIPPGIEAVIVLLLLWTQRKTGCKKHFWLLFESWIFLLLCIAELVPRLVPSLIRSLTTFEIVDRIIGVCSAAPLFLYMGFLLSISNADLIPVLPQRFRRSVKWLLLCSIVPVIATALFGGLFGLSYVENRTLVPRFQVKLASEGSKVSWTLLTSICLAILILFQFITFCLTIFRIARHFWMEKEASITARRDNDSFTIKGLGWLAAGIKLGAIEALLGFIPSGFELLLARRLVRLLSRGFLIIAVIKGMDNLDGFTLFNTETEDAFAGLPPRKIPAFMTPRNQFDDPFSTRLEKYDSNHYDEENNNVLRGSTKASGWDEEEAKQVSPKPMVGPPRTLSKYLYGERIEPPAPVQRPKPVRRAPVPDDGRRVTVRYGGNRAPTLQMRFSALGLQSPATLFKGIGSNNSPITPSDTASSKKSDSKVIEPNPFRDPENDKPQLSVDTQVGTSFTLAQPHPYALAGVSQTPKTAISEESESDIRFQSPVDKVSRSSSNLTSGSGHRSLNGLARRSSSVRRKPAPVPSPSLVNQVLPPPLPTSVSSTKQDYERHVPHVSGDSWVLPSSSGRQASTLEAVALARKNSEKLNPDSYVAPGSHESNAPLRNFRKAIDSMYAESEIEIEEKPMGRLADRAIGIERYLEEEREKSDHGHSIKQSTFCSPTTPGVTSAIVDSPAVSLAESSRSAVYAARKHTLVSEVNVRTTPRPEFQAELTRDSVMIDHIGHFPGAVAPARPPMDLPVTPRSWKAEDDDRETYQSYAGPRAF